MLRVRTHTDWQAAVIQWLGCQGKSKDLTHCEPGRHPLASRAMAATRVLSVVVGIIGIVGCGTTTGPQPAAQIQLTSNSATIFPVVCQNCGSVADQIEALATLTLRESNGVAGTVESVTMTLRRNSDNAILANATQPRGVRFAANGSVELEVGVHYDRSQGAPATLNITVNARDDNSHQITAALALPVAAFQP